MPGVVDRDEAAVVIVERVVRFEADSGAVRVGPFVRQIDRVSVRWRVTVSTAFEAHGLVEVQVLVAVAFAQVHFVVADKLEAAVQSDQFT